MLYDLIIKDINAEELQTILNATKSTEQPTEPKHEIQQVINQEAEVSAAVQGTVAPPVISEVISTPVEVEYDESGLPWDERIHASTQTKTAKGMWKKKPRVDKALVASVEAELRSAVVAPAIPPQEQAETAVGGVSHPHTQVTPAAVATTAPSATPPPPPQTDLPPVPQAQEPMVEDFANLMKVCSDLFSSGKVQADYIPSLCTRTNQAYGINTIQNITDIQSSPDYVAYCWLLIKNDGHL